jgi:hypothetical protein
MPIDPKKRERKIMKRRRKDKAAAQRKTRLPGGASPGSLVRRAREFPIMECRISADWQRGEMGLVQIIVARRHPDGGVVFGVYLVDMYCLGLKDTFCNAGFSLAQYQRDIVARVSATTHLEKCKPELAHQVIYQAIDYAARYGFKPHKDFKMSQHILEKRGALPETHILTFGKNGKPLFVQGPDDNARAIIAKLEKTAGPGNYDYVALV